MWRRRCANWPRPARSAKLTMGRLDRSKNAVAHQHRFFNIVRHHERMLPLTEACFAGRHCLKTAEGPQCAGVCQSERRWSRGR
jgi:hypothetical protein